MNKGEVYRVADGIQESRDFIDNSCSFLSADSPISVDGNFILQLLRMKS